MYIMFWNIADRALDLIGLYTVVMWAWKGSKWWQTTIMPKFRRAPAGE